MKPPEKSKAQKIALAAGAILGAAGFLVLVIFTLQRFGTWTSMILLSFILIAVQDLRTGKINILATIFPIALAAAFHWSLFLDVFLKPFLVLAAIWAAAYFISRRSPRLREILTFGFGDVLALPLALVLVLILSRGLGLMLFAGVTCAVMFWGLLAKKKFLIRLVPWLLPGVLAAWLLGFFI